MGGGGRRKREREEKGKEEKRKEEAFLIQAYTLNTGLSFLGKQPMMEFFLQNDKMNLYGKE